MRLRNLEGMKFGKLLVIRKTSHTGSKNSVWECLCDCGRTVEICRPNFVSGRTKSCGCSSVLKGDKSPRWKDTVKRYRRSSDGMLHRIVAESVLREQLPAGAVVHHVDQNKQNNERTNLVVCQDETYHRLLHRRARAYAGSGHADWLRCNYCKKYDDADNLYINAAKQSAHHRECIRNYIKARK